MSAERLSQRARVAAVLFVLGLFLAGCGGWGSGQYSDVVVAEGVALRSSADRGQQDQIRRLVAAAGDAAPDADLTIDYPHDGSLFPPEILAPTFLWHDESQGADAWLVDVAFGDGGGHLYVLLPGEQPPRGDIDPRADSETNEIYEPTPYQASAKAWKPDGPVWDAIKTNTIDTPATVTFYGYDSATDAPPLSRGTLMLATSSDPVGAPIFYRDVPLMPAPTKRGIIRPLAQSALPLIQWRLRDISLPESRVMLEDMRTCANCHSFSEDGRTMGMDVDGPTGDKGAYAIVALNKEVVIGDDEVLTWNAFKDRLPGSNTLGFLSRISPDGRHAVSTVNEEIYVANFTDYRFGQVFYPTRGVLAVYSRETQEIAALPGADDTAYVHCDPVWTPDGKSIIFARATARDAYIQGRPMATYAGDPNETPIQYDLYRIPFNDGRGGTPVPITGASTNGMSNTFPKVTRDGKWIVFVQCKNGQLMRPDGKLWIVPIEGGEPRLMNSNTSLMNSWHSFSPNGHWMVFSSKSNTPYTQMFLTHIDPDGNDSPAILVENSTAANRAVNIPEFVNVAYEDFQGISVPATEHHRYFRRGTELAKEGRYAEAVVEFDKALEGQPKAWRTNDWRIHESLSKSLLRIGDSERAFEHTQASLKLNPYNAEMHTNLGFLFTERGEYDRALEHLNLAIKLAPRFPGSWFNRATLYLRLGDHRRAVADYSEAIRVQPAFLDAYLGRGAILEGNGNLAAALTDLDAAVQINPDLPTPRYRRAMLRKRMGDLAGAAEDVGRALQAAPPGWPLQADAEALSREIQRSLGRGA